MMREVRQVSGQTSETGNHPTMVEAPLQETVRAALADLTEVPSFEEAPDLYVDWDDSNPFVVKVGKGECAA